MIVCLRQAQRSLPDAQPKGIRRLAREQTMMIAREWPAMRVAGIPLMPRFLFPANSSRTVPGEKLVRAAAGLPLDRC